MWSNHLTVSRARTPWRMSRTQLIRISLKLAEELFRRELGVGIWQLYPRWDSMICFSLSILNGSETEVLLYFTRILMGTQPRGSSFQDAKLQFADVQLALKEASGTVVFNSAGEENWSLAFCNEQNHWYVMALCASFSLFLFFFFLGGFIPELAQVCLAAVNAFDMPCAINMYITNSGQKTSAPPHTDKQVPINLLVSYSRLLWNCSLRG